MAKQQQQKEDWPELEGRISSIHFQVITSDTLGSNLEEAREIIQNDRPDLRIVVEREVLSISDSLILL